MLWQTYLRQRKMPPALRAASPLELTCIPSCSLHPCSAQCAGCRAGPEAGTCRYGHTAGSLW